VLVALVYFAAARLSLAVAIPPGYATPVWPASGIAVAAALLMGKRIWPAVWLGAALANVWVESSVLTASVIATGNTLEALVGAALIRRYAGDAGRFERAEDVVRFIVIAAVSAGVAASIAALPLANHGIGLDAGVRNWWTWWQGDVAGILLFTPLILSWLAPEEAAWPRSKKLEAAGFALLLAFAAFALTSAHASHFVPLSLTFVALPFIIWAALRFGQREVTSAIAVVCLVAIWYTVERPDLFALLPLNELLLMLLGFISMVVATGLVLVAALAARRTRAERKAGENAPWGMIPSPGRPVGQLEASLRLALEREEFELHYQAKVHVDTKEVVGLEALLRWKSPQLGLVAPAQFIGVLEESGMIVEVGQWAFRRAALDQLLWTAQGLQAPRIAINVSAIQLRSGDFVQSVRDALAGRHFIDVEITESRIMEDIDANIHVLRRLRDMGIGIAIDDFGTGYSSLAYLARLPIQTLKIDRTFIAGMLEDDENMAVVQTIISLAHSLNLRTVAEGVETQEQVDVLELLRCNEMQGYLIGRPCPRDDIAAVLRR
jgi:EAL domain-containing protein (putative c-di-GMP-specific phosphodiesterase class I)/integral membrane sensor domain MASE1